MAFHGSVAQKSLGTAQLTEGAKRALVIGNEMYLPPVPPLRNIQNDAVGMQRVLQDLGFQVSVVIDADYGTSRDKISQFIASLQKNDIGFLYYSGHGVGYQGNSYLIPTDYQNDTDSDLASRGICFETIQDAAQRRGVKNFFLVADACRDEIGGSKALDGSYELIKPSANPPGHLVSFATDYSKTATYRSRRNRNSLYTESLLLYLSQPLEVNEIFRRARNRTYQESKRLNEQGIPTEIQIPDIDNRIFDDFYFLKKKPEASGKRSEMSGSNWDFNTTGPVSTKGSLSNLKRTIGGVCIINPNMYGRKIFISNTSGFIRDLTVGPGIGKKEEGCLLDLPTGVYTLTAQTLFSNYTVMTTQIQILENQTVQIDLPKDEFN